MLAAYTAVLGVAGLRVRRGESRAGSTTTRWPRACRCSSGTPRPTPRCARSPKRGELHKPEVLRAQTERLLNDPKSRRFVEAFTDYWLDLRKIDDTRLRPRSTTITNWTIRSSSPRSRRRGCSSPNCCRADLPARNVVDSDFTFLNERLAKHYGIPGVTGVDDAQGHAAAGQRARRPHDAGQRAQGDRQRHDDFAGAARPLDHRADPRHRDAAATADRRRPSSRTSAAP